MAQLLYSATRHQAKSHPSWSLNAVLYELNLRQFTHEGTFVSAAAHLERLRNLGVDIIWLMPIFPIGEDRRKGSLGSYYSIRDYTAVNPEFGSLDDLRMFIHRAHELGMRVILDWVANHTSRDAVWTTEHPDWYEWDDQAGEIATPFDWSDTAKLNYANYDMRAAMIGALKYWIMETGLDGYRCDMAMLVPNDFWAKAIGELQHVKSDIFMLAEAQGPEFHAVGFDVTYSWDIFHTLDDIAQNKAIADTLCHRLMTESLAYPADAIRMQFTSNHDENSWNGTEYERLGAAALQMTALTYVLPGMPLIYNGQEVGLNRRLAFFDKDEIHWPVDETPIGSLYRELSTLKHQHPALLGGKEGGDLVRMDNSENHRVLTVKRKLGDHLVIALFNFSATDAVFRIWDDDFAGEFTQIGSLEGAELFGDRDFYLPAHGWFVYFR